MSTKTMKTQPFQERPHDAYYAMQDPEGSKRPHDAKYAMQDPEGLKYTKPNQTPAPRMNSLDAMMSS